MRVAYEMIAGDACCLRDFTAGLSCWFFCLLLCCRGPDKWRILSRGVLMGPSDIGIVAFLMRRIMTHHAEAFYAVSHRATSTHVEVITGDSADEVAEQWLPWWLQAPSSKLKFKYSLSYANIKCVRESKIFGAHYCRRVFAWSIVFNW